jgi:hypothetical protein
MLPTSLCHNVTKGKYTNISYNQWTEAEVLSHLTTNWGLDTITELKLEYFYEPEPEVSGE